MGVRRTAMNSVAQSKEVSHGTGVSPAVDSHARAITECSKCPNFQPRMVPNFPPCPDLSDS